MEGLLMLGLYLLVLAGAVLLARKSPMGGSFIVQCFSWVCYVVAAVLIFQFLSRLIKGGVV